MSSSPTQRALFLVLPLGIMLGVAGAYAASPHLDTATSHVEKAIEELRAANNPAERGEFGGHRSRAIELLGDVKREIKKAKEFDDRHPGKPQPEPKPSGGHMPKPTPSSGPPPSPKPPTPGPSGSPGKPLPGPTPGPKK